MSFLIFLDRVKMAVWGILLTAATLLGPMVSGDKIKVSQHCVTSNSSIDSVYAYAEKGLNSSRTLRLSKFSGKVTSISDYYSRGYQFLTVWQTAKGAHSVSSDTCFILFSVFPF
jgi:hypothetical protein